MKVPAMIEHEVMGGLAIGICLCIVLFLTAYYYTSQAPQSHPKPVYRSDIPTILFKYDGRCFVASPDTVTRERECE